MQIDIDLAPAWAWNDPTIPTLQSAITPAEKLLTRTTWLAMLTDPTTGDTYMRLFRNAHKPSARDVFNLWEHQPQLFLFTPNPNTDDVLPA